MKKGKTVPAASLVTAGRILIALFHGWSILPAATGSDTEVFQPSSWEPLSSRDCPTNCEDVFGRLKHTTHEGKKVQHVEVQERGEPKSGTNLMYEWGSGAITHSCVYLQRAFGRHSCRVESSDDGTRTLIFEPHLARKDRSAPCSCDTVQMVSISISSHQKHMLPVRSRCSWAHNAGLAKKQQNICTPADGEASPPTNQTDLWNCVANTPCGIVDHRLQLSIARDPREVTVSTYFHRVFHGLDLHGIKSVDEFVVDMLPTICQWVSLRFLLFEIMLKKQTSSFWYNDALADPNHWHERFLRFVGLNMPTDVINNAAKIVADGGPILGFPSKGINVHVGGGDVKVSRTYRDEVTADTLSGMDDVLRTWLPPVLLEKFGVAL